MFNVSLLAHIMSSGERKVQKHSVFARIRCIAFSSQGSCVVQATKYSINALPQDATELCACSKVVRDIDNVGGSELATIVGKVPGKKIKVSRCILLVHIFSSTPLDYCPHQI